MEKMKEVKFVEFDSMEVVKKLKEKFTDKQIKEISFAINENSDNLKEVLETITEKIFELENSEYKEFFINSITEKINEDTKYQIENYYKTEDYLSNYFLDIDIDYNLNCNFFTYDNNKNMELKTLICKLVDNLSCYSDFIDSMEFNYDSYGNPFHASDYEIEFSYPMGEVEIQIPEELTKILDDTDNKTELEIKNNLEYCMNSSNEYIYCNLDYDIVSYSMNFNKFFLVIIELLDEDNNEIEINLLMEMYNLLKYSIENDEIEISKNNIDNLLSLKKYIANTEK